MKTKKSWASIFDWYNTGDFVKENLNLLKKGTLEEQIKALRNIELEIEHQGSLSYLAPFAVKELITIIEEPEILVSERIEKFLCELKKVI